MDGGPIFSKSVGNEIWVLLLEKAYAKIYGSYDKIEAGLAGHALRDLTGAPFEYFVRNEEDGHQIPISFISPKNVRSDSPITLFFHGGNN